MVAHILLGIRCEGEDAGIIVEGDEGVRPFVVNYDELPQLCAVSGVLRVEVHLVPVVGIHKGALGDGMDQLPMLRDVGNGDGLPQLWREVLVIHRHHEALLRASPARVGRGHRHEGRPDSRLIRGSIKGPGALVKGHPSGKLLVGCAEGPVFQGVALGVGEEVLGKGEGEGVPLVHVQTLRDGSGEVRRVIDIGHGHVKVEEAGLALDVGGHQPHGVGTVVHGVLQVRAGRAVGCPGEGLCGLVEGHAVRHVLGGVGQVAALGIHERARGHGEDPLLVLGGVLGVDAAHRDGRLRRVDDRHGEARLRAGPARVGRGDGHDPFSRRVLSQPGQKPLLVGGRGSVKGAAGPLDGHPVGELLVGCAEGPVLQGVAVRVHKGARGHGEQPRLPLLRHRDSGDGGGNIGALVQDAVEPGDPLRVKVRGPHVNTAGLQDPVAAICRVSGGVRGGCHAPVGQVADSGQEPVAGLGSGHVAGQKVNPAVICEEIADLLPEPLMGLIRLQGIGSDDIRMGQVQPRVPLAVRGERDAVSLLSAQGLIDQGGEPLRVGVGGIIADNDHVVPGRGREVVRVRDVRGYRQDTESVRLGIRSVREIKRFIIIQVIVHVGPVVRLQSMEHLPHMLFLILDLIQRVLKARAVKNDPFFKLP